MRSALLRLPLAAAVAAAALFCRRSTAPGLAGPAPPTREGSVTTGDGVRLHYRQVGTRGDTLLFLHGGPGQNYQGVGPDLDALGEQHVLLMYDQRGGGRSERGDTTALAAATHVRDVDAVRRHFGIGRMTLIGHSWGTGLATLYAAEHPERVARLLLLAPMPPARDPFNAQRGEALARSRNAIAAATGLRVTADADSEPRAWCEQTNAVNLRLYYLDTLAMRRRRGDYCAVPEAGIRSRTVTSRATMRSLGDWDFRPLLRRLTMPVLVIEGAESPVPLDQVRVWAAEAPEGRVLIVPRSGHAYQMVERPELFFPAVEQFLRGQWPAGAERP